MKLMSLNVDGVADLLKTMKELQNSPNLEKYIDIIRSNNIIGSVLFYCDLNDLKKVRTYLDFVIIWFIENVTSTAITVIDFRPCK